MLPDRELSLRQGAIRAMGFGGVAGDGVTGQYFEALGEKYGFDMDTPVSQMTPEAVHAILYGTDGEKLTVTYETANGVSHFQTAFAGIIPTMERRYRETTSESMKSAYEEYMQQELCPACHGKRLKPESLGVTVGEYNIAQVSELSVVQSRA